MITKMVITFLKLAGEKIEGVIPAPVTGHALI
jgi:hypothetical protein